MNDLLLARNRLNRVSHLPQLSAIPCREEGHTRDIFYRKRLAFDSLYYLVIRGVNQETGVI